MSRLNPNNEIEIEMDNENTNIENQIDKTENDIIDSEEYKLNSSFSSNNNLINDISITTKNMELVNNSSKNIKDDNDNDFNFMREYEKKYKAQLKSMKDREDKYMQKYKNITDKKINKLSENDIKLNDNIEKNVDNTNTSFINKQFKPSSPKINDKYFSNNNNIKQFDEKLSMTKKLMIFQGYVINTKSFIYMRKIFNPKDKSFHLYFSFKYSDSGPINITFKDHDECDKAFDYYKEKLNEIFE